MKEICRNCGGPAKAKYCPDCGQPTVEPRGPLFGLLGDFFTEFLSLDGRHLRTVLKLAIPGRLTLLYLAGKRASHIPPVRVYFVSSLLFFLLVGFPSPDADKTNVYVNDVLVGREVADPELGNAQLIDFEDSALGTRVQTAMFPDLDRLTTMDPQVLLDGFFGGLERTIPAALICFLPILALGLKLLYVRRGVFYVDHLVFAIHLQSFLFASFVVARLVNVAGLGRLYPGILSYVLVLLLVMPLYMLFAVKRVYEQSWIWTGIKTILLCLMYLMLLQPVVLLTAAVVIRRL